MPANNEALKCKTLCACISHAQCRIIERHKYIRALLKLRVLLGTGWMPQSGCGRVRMRTHARLISRPGHVLMLPVARRTSYMYIDRLYSAA